MTMKNWRPMLEIALKDLYPGVKAIWTEDSEKPTLRVPAAYRPRLEEIANQVCILWTSWGGEINAVPILDADLVARHDRLRLLAADVISLQGGEDFSYALQALEEFLEN